MADILVKTWTEKKDDRGFIHYEERTFCTMLAAAKWLRELKAMGKVDAEIPGGYARRVYTLAGIN